MYFTKTIEEILNDPENYSNYKLCYIEDASVDPYEDEEEQTIQEVEKIAYFSSESLENTWGDDWDDIPYEHNATGPYDSSCVECSEEEYRSLDKSKRAIRYDVHKQADKYMKIVKYSVLCVHFFLSKNQYYYKEPKNYSSDGGYNSIFSVANINSGMVPWLWIGKGDLRRTISGTSIMAGIDPYKFILKLSEVK